MSEMVSQIVTGIGERFRTFGGDRDFGNNPIAYVLRGKPLQFAAAVDVEEVVRFIIGAMREPTEAMLQAAITCERGEPRRRTVGSVIIAEYKAMIDETLK